MLIEHWKSVLLLQTLLIFKDIKPLNGTLTKTVIIHHPDWRTLRQALLGLQAKATTCQVFGNSENSYLALEMVMKTSRWIGTVSVLFILILPIIADEEGSPPKHQVKEKKLINQIATVTLVVQGMMKSRSGAT